MVWRFYFRALPKVSWPHRPGAQATAVQLQMPSFQYRQSTLKPEQKTRPFSQIQQSPHRPRFTWIVSRNNHFFHSRDRFILGKTNTGGQISQRYSGIFKKGQELTPNASKSYKEWTEMKETLYLFNSTNSDILPRSEHFYHAFFPTQPGAKKHS